jgi:amino acid efflux transporter
MNDKLQLKKSITWLQGTALTIGAVLGSGILVLPAIAAELAGPASLLSWLLMGLFSLPMVITIGLMSSRYPDAGGMASYARYSFGRRLEHLTGLLIISAMPFGMPLTALVGAHYLGSAFSWSSGEIHAAAAGLLLVAIFLNYRGIELSGRSQIVVVSVILFILSFAVMSAASNISTAAFVPLLPNSWLPVGQTMTLLFFAFMGWEMIGHLAEEFKNPVRDLPLSLGLAFLFINAIYLAIAVVTIGTEVYKTGNPVTAMVTLVSYRWGQLAGILVGILGFVVCYCPIHTFIAGFSRLVYSQAREGHFPQVLGQLHPRFRTPHIALLVFIPLFLIILTFSYLFVWDLKPLIGIPSTTFLVVYMIGMISAARVLSNKVGKTLAWLSALLSCIIFIFAGWYIAFPVLVVSAFTVKYRRELFTR